MNGASEHPDRDQLSAFMAGRLESADQAAIESHIAGCKVCCQQLREVPDDGLVGRIRGAMTPAGDAPARQPPHISGLDQLPKELRDHPRYRITRFLGAGGMGIVYQAEHRLMERVVALKIIHDDLVANPHAVERFRQEVKAAARLSHPNIVTAYDAEQAGNIHFLVMEFVDGISLSRLVQRRGALAVANACHYARQAAKGLQHAFESSMVHRDIKPHNLMLTRKGQVKILDFGLARLASESRGDIGLTPGRARPGLTIAGDVMGTPDYMAPEQTYISRPADIRTDLYSLGCTLYYLLAGQAPFAESSTEAKLFCQRYDRPRPITELREDVPSELAAVLDRMMAKDPAYRYQTPAEVVKALSPFLRSTPAGADEPGTLRKPEAPLTGDRAEPVEAIDLSPRSGGRVFLARCPFCPTRVRVPSKALGASILCPQCGSYFTAVPEDE